MGAEGRPDFIKLLHRINWENNFMLRHKGILILSLAMAFAALTLGAIAFRYAGKEAEYREQEVRKALQQQTRMIAGQCLNIIKQEQRNLVKELRNSQPAGEDLLKIYRSNPLLREVFITDFRGVPIFPKRNNDFYKRYANLFLDLRKGTFKPQVNSQPIAVRNQKRSSFNKKLSWDYFSSNTNANVDVQQQTDNQYNQEIAQQVQTLIPQTEDAQKKQISSDLSNLFFKVTQGASSGWVPWFSDNRFCPLVWSRCAKDQSKIVGGEIETVALISRIIMAFPQEVPEYYRFELTDAQGRLIYGVGGQYKSDDKPAKVQADVSDEIAPLQMPNFRIRGYLDPAYKVGSQNLALANLIQIISLILILIAGGLMLFWMMRRELVLAGQKSSFVANVSHELKTPLTSIRMYAELLETKKDLDTGKKNKYLKVILSESERLSRLISNVLDFSKLEEGRKKYKPEEINLTELIMEIAETHRPSLQEHNMALKMDFPSQEIRVKVDRDSLVQVLQNLIGNAVKYASSGEEFTLSLSKEADSLAVIRVLDRGLGIPLSQHQKIFKKFYRCDNSLTTDTSGSGLGLAIARNLMREQKGDLTCYSRDGGGMEFRIVLPL